jgi:hypothetical protein
MRYLLPVVILVFLSGCNDLNGQLNVSRSMKLKNSKNDEKVIAVGTYSAELKRSTFGKKIVLKLNNDQDQKYEFKIPDGTSIPTNGTFSLASADIGQPVNLKGVVSTKVTDTTPQEVFQACTYTEPYTVCTAGPNGQQICNTYQRTMQGTQWVRYYDHYVDQNIQMSIIAVNESVASSEFLGDLSTVQRITTQLSSCR